MNLGYLGHMWHTGYYYIILLFYPKYPVTARSFRSEMGWAVFEVHGTFLGYYGHMWCLGYIIISERECTLRSLFIPFRNGLCGFRGT